MVKQLTIEQAINLAHKFMLEFKENLPIITAQGQGEPFIVGIPEFPKTHKERLRKMYNNGFAYWSNGVIGSELQQVFLTCRGWMSPADKDQKLYKRPPRHTDRTETLIISGFNVPDNQTTFKIYQITRDQDKLAGLQLLNTDAKKLAQTRTQLLQAFVTGFQKRINIKSDAFKPSFLQT